MLCPSIEVFGSVRRGLIDDEADDDDKENLEEEAADAGVVDE
jgi:hypothetical protein